MGEFGGISAQLEGNYAGYQSVCERGEGNSNIDLGEHCTAGSGE
jgi:hypothetical protein